MKIQYASEPLRITDNEYWLSEKRETLYWLDNYGPKAHLKLWVRDQRDLTAEENLDMLWVSNEPKPEEEISGLLQSQIDSGRVIRINTAHKDYPEWIEQTRNRHSEEEYFAAGEYVGGHKSKLKRINILGLGDVGSTMALALCLYGKGTISEIGIFDLDENRMSRWEQELNQIAEPLQDGIPKVKPITMEELFDCDVFAFTASVGVPPISITEGDVRVVQFKGNSELVAKYAQMAVERHYKGIFAVVSDPVDQLCRHAYQASNQDAQGHWHGKGLAPEQIRGYGLGVMNGRAAYFAKEEGKEFNPNGRVYGPHGKGLVVANDWAKGSFDSIISEKWTEQTITANLKMRAIGHKPYIAPAVASGAISLVKTLRGEPHYSCVSFNGFYYGCLNQNVGGMDVIERLDSDLALIARIKSSAEELDAQWQSLQ